MEQPALRPRVHIFVCTNEREEGRDCCANVHGMEIFRALKDWVRQQGLARDVWVTRTGCMTFCNNEGATIAIYPKNVWFTKVRMGELGKVQDRIRELGLDF